MNFRYDKESEDKYYKYRIDSKTKPEHNQCKLEIIVFVISNSFRDLPLLFYLERIRKILKQVQNDVFSFLIYCL